MNAMMRLKRRILKTNKKGIEHPKYKMKIRWQILNIKYAELKLEEKK